jgi:SH3-like domain-containing protein
MFALAAGATAAEAQGTRGKGGLPATTGFPIPRFVTLRSSEVNLRAGPSVNYPIEWVFTRKDMPVEITAEFDTWRRIRDWQGSEGWVHQQMLSGKRGVVITGSTRSLRAEPRADAGVVAQANPGVMGALLRCNGPWCQVDLKGYRGWLQRSEFWGVYDNETVN